MLTALVVVATSVGLVVSDEDGVIVLCGLTGAIGGTLAGARSIRDTRKMRDALFFQTWWWVQPAVGFAVGLFIYAPLSPESSSCPAPRAATPTASRPLGSCIRS
jgi:hypothetical protein